MAEFRFVMLPREGALKAADRERNINSDLAELVADGWEPISIAKPDTISQVSFLLKRGA